MSCSLELREGWNGPFFLLSSMQLLWLYKIRHCGLSPSFWSSRRWSGAWVAAHTDGSVGRCHQSLLLSCHLSSTQDRQVFYYCAKISFPTVILTYSRDVLVAPSIVVLVLSCYKKMPQAGTLKLILSQLWRLDVQDGAASRAGVWWGLCVLTRPCLCMQSL